MKPSSIGLLLTVMMSFLWAGAPGSIVPDEQNGRVNSIFSDSIAYRVGEPITVVVDLSSTVSASRSLATSKTSAINEGTLTSPLIPSEFINNYGFSMGGNTSHTGTGSLADNVTLTTTFTGKIMEIFPNDTYKIQAHRTFTVGKEKSELILSGIVRSWDINNTNQVNSSLIADLQVEQKGAGPISRSTDKGWLTTVFEFLSPF